MDQFSQVATMIILKIMADGFVDKYLSLPLPEERVKVGKFQFAKDNSEKAMLLDWKYASGGKFR